MNLEAPKTKCCDVKVSVVSVRQRSEEGKMVCLNEPWCPKCKKLLDREEGCKEI